MFISDFRVRWTGHLAAISISFARCSGVNAPLNLISTSIRSSIPSFVSRSAPTSVPSSLPNSHTDLYRITPDMFSVVEQEKPEKADQNPEHRAKNSEPECRVPIGVGDGIGFCSSHFLS